MVALLWFKNAEPVLVEPIPGAGSQHYVTWERAALRLMPNGDVDVITNPDAVDTPHAWTGTAQANANIAPAARD